MPHPEEADRVREGRLSALHVAAHILQTHAMLADGLRSALVFLIEPRGHGGIGSHGHLGVLSSGTSEIRTYLRHSSETAACDRPVRSGSWTPGAHREITPRRRGSPRRRAPQGPA